MHSSEPAGRRVRVLIVSAYAAPHVGGVEVVVSQQARTLAALGYQVRVVTSRSDRTSARRERADGFETIRLPAWNVLEARAGAPFPLWSPASLARIARLAAAADIVHVHDAYHPSSLLAGLAARARSRPLFVTQHVAVVEHDKPAVSFAQRLCYAILAAPLWRSARTVTVYNPIVARFLAERGVAASKIRLVYNGIDTAEFTPGDQAATAAVRARYGLDPELPVVLFVGRLVPKKGVRQLIAAGDPRYQLVLAGPGEVPDPAPDGVRFLGPVSRPELPALYQASDIFALPAVGEMLTLTMQEAMACGLPVVTTSDPAYAGYDLDPAGIALVDPDPDVLRREFLDILGDDARRSYMSRYSRQLAKERFDWHRNAVDLAADYSRARSEARPRPRRAGGA
jgi:glycosyltransferase involved in cell wall biosynthesis